MEIKIKQPKISNLYSFISNLSQWNELVCVPQRKKEWIDKTGKLNRQEIDAIKEFSNILQKTDENIEPIFLFSDEGKIWNDLSSKISAKEIDKLKEIFHLFEKRFDKIWRTEKEKLQNIIQEFKRKKQEIVQRINIIGNLCGLEKGDLPKIINLHLILSSESQDDCQAWSFKGIIALECSGWPKDKIDFLINNIFIHECFHLLFKINKELSSSFQKKINEDRELIERFSFKLWEAEIIFEEALISSFLPEGYLGEIFSGNDVRKIAEKELLNKQVEEFEKLRYYCALKLYDLAKDYIDNKKVLDGYYFKQVIKCIGDFKI